MYKERLVALMDSFFDEPCKETPLLYRDHLVHPSLVWPNKVRGCEGGADHDPVGVAGKIQLPSFIPRDCIFDGQVAKYCTAFLRVDIEVFAREPNHRLEISNEIVTFLLVLEIHLVCRLLLEKKKTIQKDIVFAGEDCLNRRDRFVGVSTRDRSVARGCSVQ